MSVAFTIGAVITGAALFLMNPHLWLPLRTLFSSLAASGSALILGIFLYFDTHEQSPD